MTVVLVVIVGGKHGLSPVSWFGRLFQAFEYFPVPLSEALRVIDPDPRMSMDVT
jgi:hypothetical protein